jgi:hypothetical protein
MGRHFSKRTSQCNLKFLIWYVAAVKFDDNKATKKQFVKHSINRAGLLIENIQGVSRLVDITAGGDFLGLCDKKKFI